MEEEEGEKKCLIARLGKQNELVLTTHLGICVLTLWQLEEPLKAAQAATAEVKEKREEGKKERRGSSNGRTVVLRPG